MRKMKEIKLGDTFYVSFRSGHDRLPVLVGKICRSIQTSASDSQSVKTAIISRNGSSYPRESCFADMYEFLQWADDESCKILEDDGAKKKLDERLAERKEEIENEDSSVKK